MKHLHANNCVSVMIPREQLHSDRWFGPSVSALGDHPVVSFHHEHGT